MQQTIYCNRKGLQFITNCFSYKSAFETTFLYNGNTLIGQISHRDCAPGFTAVVCYDNTITQLLQSNS